MGTWILDFVNSDHIVGNPSLISNLAPLKTPYNITLANGSNAQVIGIGHASPLPSLSLNYVLYVPASPFNTISFTKLSRSIDCLVTFSSDSFFIQDSSTRKTIITGFKSEGIYYVHPHPSTVCSSSTSMDIVQRGLDHLSLDKELKSLRKDINGSAFKSNARSNGTPRQSSNAAYWSLLEQEVRVVLMQRTPLTPKELVAIFKGRLRCHEDKLAFAEILKKTSKIKTTNGSKYVILRKNL